MNQFGFGNLLQAHDNYVEFAVGSYYSDIKRFSHGQTIGSAETYGGNSYYDFSNVYEEFGEYAFYYEHGEYRNNTGYAGLRLTDGTNTYYGWIQVSVANYNNANITGTLIDWAYNSIPNSPIPAGLYHSQSGREHRPSGGHHLAHALESAIPASGNAFADGSRLDKYRAANRRRWQPDDPVCARHQRGTLLQNDCRFAIAQAGFRSVSIAKGAVCGTRITAATANARS